ncbi:MAG: CusA/CzcA family heavy metal efflux RND transporter [Bacteroidales bacterium]|nr:CusA/CzcA family heavy metal efflux RND transporter [Bacteroidales bacterium]
MFRKVIEFSIQNKAIIGFLVIVMIGFGIYSMTQLPIDAVPDITNNQVQVVTTAPSLSPQEVERFITYPLEISMANITDVIEIRSISRYGLSVLTIVFKEKVPILHARQLVSEQIKLAESDIPEGLGIPEMLPITTGLGEVFQYTLEVKKGYEGKYSATDLREIQDWIIKRQLSGIPGIVEISSFGGYLKQFEIAVDPMRMKSLRLTCSDVFEAVSKNNQNTGGSYIEKSANAYYIRTEGLLKNISDIENVVVTNRNGNPVLIKHIADVYIGFAPRFGAMTKNGKGEAVGGITLMLKGASSSKVVKEVKEKIKRVEKSLPEGITINPYLDRAELISKTTNTVTKNLIEGGLIVIFILVLLLGHFRSGLIVASVIPLSMLFGFIMMHIFGVSANLMSLGAIDFGIVVDGAVIIVESIIYHVYKDHVGKVLSRKETDTVVKKASASIYQSASFGVIIILIVFIPIMALTGIEGKTFRPMAQTFCFVILGAFFLSMTYVPMMSALLLNKKIEYKKTLSDRVIRFLKLTYHPILKFSLANKYTILIVTAIVFMISIWSFTKLGGEFVPTLEEGDLAMQMTIPAGSSLSQSIITTTRAEKILMENFPEVQQVISKIGTAEVPTDPMAIEDADIMIILKDKKQWVSAKNREELIEKMKAKLGVITAAQFEFTQPIQLRFNELITGVKTDIAVKIYGEDLDELYAQANKAAGIISKLEGAADVKVEQITGLPQLVIQFDHKKIARYGLNISQLNSIIRTAYAGEKAGVIFEGERKFDLVVRMDSSLRTELNLNKLSVPTPDGQIIPLSEVAKAVYIEGPVHIARDGTKRRITIGINVRNRDIQSLVSEIDNKLASGLILKPGYYTTYGGQFENLQNAKKRLTVALPVALLLILIMLFFTFNSIKYALLIFTAVPLSAVGGIAALWIRGLPFSISAGVGFIALFGVAVLNGIVLISNYNEMKAQGIENIKYIVIKGACTRLRPVMMTATTDILGFLPMAVAVSAGAEVQRPLATVVIGGIITSTMLTLIILPILYLLINQERKSGPVFRKFKKPALIMISFIILFPALVRSQETSFKKLTADEAVRLALANNAVTRNAVLEVEKAKALKNGAFQFQPTEFVYQYGQINSPVNDRYIEINQDFGSLLQHINRHRAYNKLWELSRIENEIINKELTAQVKSAYYFWIYLHNRLEILNEQKNLYSDLIRISELHYKLGATNLLEKTMAAARQAQVEIEYNMLQDDLIIAQNKLKQLIVTDEEIIPASPELVLYMVSKPSPDSDYKGKLLLSLLEKNSEVKQAQLGTERSAFFPEISAGYFYQDIGAFKGLYGWQIGLAFPLWFPPVNSNIKKAKAERDIELNTLEQHKFSIEKDIENLLFDLNKYFKQIEFFKKYALVQADELIKTASIQFNKEEIEYTEFIHGISTGLNLKMEYLETINNYNQTAIQLEIYAN